MKKPIRPENVAELIGIAAAVIAGWWFYEPRLLPVLVIGTLWCAAAGAAIVYVMKS